MGCSQWAVGVGWYEVVGCKRVIGAIAFAAYPAGDSVVSDLLGSLSIVAFVMGSVWFGVLLIPEGLAACAACGVGCEVAAVETGSMNRHQPSQPSTFQNSRVGCGWVLIACCIIENALDS